jgi:PAS domain S-box-containing protein
MPTMAMNMDPTARTAGRMSRAMMPLAASVWALVIVFAASKAPGAEVPESPQEARHVTLQLKWRHQFQFAGYYVAQTEGFFAEEGLHVSILEGGPGISVADRVASGEADFGVLASELVLERINGKPLVLLAVIMQHSPRALLVRTDSNISAPSHLAGRNIVLNQYEQAEFLAMFLREGISPDRLNILPKDETTMDRLIQGDIDAMNGSVGNQPFTLQELGVPVRLIRPINYGIDFYGDCLFTSEQMDRRHPELVDAFRRASLRGWEHAMANVDLTIETIQARFATAKSRDHLRYEADALRTVILPELVEVGHVNPGRLARIAKSYADLRLAPLDSGDRLEAFTWSAHRESVPTRAGWLLKIATVTLVLVAAIACGVVLLNRRLAHTVKNRTSELQRVNLRLQERITAHERALAALEESEERLRELARFPEQSPNPVMRVDSDGTILYANQAGGPLLAAWGTKTGASIPDDLKTVAAEAMASHETQIREILADGQALVLTFAPIHETETVNVYGMNISNRKRAEDELRMREELLALMSRIAKVGAWEFDAATREGTWTEEVARIHDLDPEAETDMNLGLSFYSGDSRRKIESAVQRAIGQGKPYDLELEMTSATGKNKWVRTIGHPVVQDDQVVRVRGTFQDVTERKQAEEELDRYRGNLEGLVAERTEQLQTIVDAMADRELRMVELKGIIARLRDQIEEAGMAPLEEE